MTTREHGGATVEFGASALFLIVLLSGVLQVASVVHARTVARTAAHEGARAAVETGEIAVVREVVVATLDHRLDDVSVDVTLQDVGDAPVVHVAVSGTFDPFGPVAGAFEITARASEVASRGQP